MNEFFGQIGIGPGSTVIAALIFGMFKMGWDWREKVQKAGAESRGSRTTTGEAPTATWQINMTAAVTSLAGAVNALGEKTEAGLEELGETRRGVDAANARLALLPTREDLAKTAQDNRHAMAGTLQLLTAKVDSIILELKIRGA